MQFAQVNLDILICQPSQQSLVLIAVFYLKSPKAEISFLNVQMLFFFSFPYTGERSGKKSIKKQLILMNRLMSVIPQNPAARESF